LRILERDVERTEEEIDAVRFSPDDDRAVERLLLRGEPIR